MNFLGISSKITFEVLQIFLFEEFQKCILKANYQWVGGFGDDEKYNLFFLHLKPGLRYRQACSSQILYLSNSTKITTNTESAMSCKV